MRSQTGCKASFAELVHRYDRRLHGFLRQRTACASDAEDLVQDTFVKAYANLHRYDDSWKFSTWLFTIARRIAVSHYRRTAVAASAELPSEPFTTPAPPDLLADRDTQRNLWQLAQKLPESQYRALWLRYAEAMPVKHIAKALGKTRINVKVLLHRARTNLAKRIEQSPNTADIVELAASIRSIQNPTACEPSAITADPDGHSETFSCHPETLSCHPGTLSCHPERSEGSPSRFRSKLATMKPASGKSTISTFASKGV